MRAEEMDGHYAESQQSEERLEEEGSVSRSRETGPAAASDYGVHSPRPARSQISTAVSFEPAHPANSAANAARSGEDSAASAAEPEGELSSLPQEPLQGIGQQVMSREALAYPSGSLISTAMRPAANAAHQPRSPPAERATSVVSKTALRRSPEAIRAGTPASVYAQDRAPQRRPLDASPHDSQAIEQDSNEGRAARARQAIQRPAGSTAPGGHPQRSEWQEASVLHYDGAVSQPPDSHASRPVPELQQNSQEGMQEGCLSAEERDNSIEAVQEGDMYLEDVAAAASVARSGPGDGAALEQQLAGLPSAYHAALAAMAEGVTLERSASAGSERNADARRNGDNLPLGILAAALEQSLQPPWPGPGTGQSSWVSRQGAAGQAGAWHPRGHAGPAQHAQGGFHVPALPTNSPFVSLASRFPAVLDAVMRSDHGLPTSAEAHEVRQELANALSPCSPAARHSHGPQPERVASTRLPGSVRGAGADGALPALNGGSNEPSEMPRAAGSNENRASQQSMEDFMQQRLYTAGSLACPAEGELRDPSLAQERQSAGSPAMEDMRREDAAQRPFDFDFASPGQAGLQLGRAIAQQEAHSGAAAAQGRPAGDFLHGADSGAMPALSIIRGLSGPFPAGFLPGHACAAQRRAQGAGEAAPALHAPGAQDLGEHGALQPENSLASLAPRIGAMGAQSPHGGPAHANHPAPADTAHAAASVHATVMSEEDAMSEGETHLSSRRAAASQPARGAQAGQGAYAQERHAPHHTAGLARKEQMREAMGTSVRPEPVQPIDSTTAMAAAVAPTASCEQSVEMCPHGSPSAEAMARELANSSDSSPARALASKHRSSSREGGQGVNSAPARLHRSANSDAHMESGGRSAPNGLAGHHERPMHAGRDEYDVGPQNSNGTTMGQVLAAGAPSTQPEGSLGSHAAVEQLQSPPEKEAISHERGRPAAAAQAAMPAASANMGMSLPIGCPPLHRAARLGSSSMRNRPTAPTFPAGLAQDAAGADVTLQNGGAAHAGENRAHGPLRHTASSPLQAGAPAHSPHQMPGTPAPDADSPAVAMSGGQPAHATVVVGAQSARGSPPLRHELQSQPMSRADRHQEAAPQPALTVIMPSGILPHVSEGRGESQPAAHSPEFQSHNLRGSAPPNSLPQSGAAARASAHAHENHAQSHRARAAAANNAHSNGHTARTEGALGVHDVLSGEDSAPDTGRAVTSPAPGSTPGRRRNSFGKRKRVNGGAVDQSRSRYSATQCS